MRLFLDACILIFLIEKVAGYHPRVTDSLRKRHAQRIYWTDMLRLELRVKPLREHDNGLLACYEHFLNSPATRHIPMDRKIYDLATDLRARHGIKTPDALHLAAALDAGCDELWTNDDRLTKAAAGRIEIVTFD